MCGKPLYEYDHIVPYEIAKQHAIENIVLLCNNHHAEKTKGLIKEAEVCDALSCPFNVVAGESSRFLLRYRGGIGSVEID